MLSTLNGSKKDRVQSLRSSLVSTIPGICPERIRIYTQTYQKFNQEPQILKRAHSLKAYMENITISLEKDDLIPGWQTSHPRWVPIFPEYSWKWVYEELDRFNKRQYDRFTISPQTRDELHQLLPWWEGRTIYDRVFARQPQYVLDASSIGAINWTGQATSGEGHIVVDHKLTLDYGFSGILARVTKLKQDLALYEPNNLDKRDFYQSVEIVFEGVLNYINRLIEITQENIKSVSTERKLELQKMVMDLKAIHNGPPQSFRQAMYIIWLVQMIQQVESNGHSFSL